jgi:ribosomal protein L30/L7E
MPSPNQKKALINKINAFFENEKRRAQRKLINKINAAVGVKYFVQSPNGTLMYAVRTPINKKNNVRKVLKY